MKKGIIEWVTQFTPLVLSIILLSMGVALIHSVIASGIVVVLYAIGYTAWVVVFLAILIGSFKN
ncbi:MAG: hypothetical protein CMF22_10245 [Idiomarinaceae bacterium]|nr:hypothetical protein [Idiomarinaceae bacterium]MBG23822.1 hypothetical protein [Idiomarinaceae bacterium]|tara:strand:- start:35085 stop:35276 length:192 start_codon:yes stop_codon:yes gene_type:complete